MDGKQQCYLGGAGAREREDSMSREIQNATDQVTEPVNIADADDPCRSLNAQWNSSVLWEEKHPGFSQEQLLRTLSSTLLEAADWLQNPASWVIDFLHDQQCHTYQMAPIPYPARPCRAAIPQTRVKFVTTPAVWKAQRLPTARL